MFTKTQEPNWAIVMIYSLSTCVMSFSIALHAPFYPLVAESKGAPPSLYGVVFGIFDLILLLLCPLFGKLIPHFGAKLVAFNGIFTLGVCNILFGFVDWVYDSTTFISLSLAIRITEAIGYAGFRTASISIVSYEFKDKLEAGFGIVQAFYGLGVVIGPAVGGFLFEVGGFNFPFTLVGSLLLCASVVILSFPLSGDVDVKVEESSNDFKNLLCSAFTILSMFNLFIVHLGLSFIDTVLEPHIRQLNLQPRYVGLIFICIAFSFSISSFIWGKVFTKCDSPRLMWSGGALISIISLLLIGPAPYFSFHLKIEIAVLALILLGIGEGAQIVGGFAGINKAAVEAGYPKSLKTHSLISSLYMCSASSGMFIGPIIGGILYDCIGFRWATQLYCGLQLVIVMLTWASKVIKK